MAAAHPPSLLCHWDGSSCLGLLISVQTSLPHGIIHYLCPSCSICVCHCSHPSLLEETLVADPNISGCGFCVMHVVAIPDHRTQFVCTIYTALPSLEPDTQVLRLEMYMVYTEGLEPVTFAVTFLEIVGCLHNVLFENGM